MKKLLTQSKLEPTKETMNTLDGLKKIIKIKFLLLL